MIVTTRQLNAAIIALEGLEDKKSSHPPRPLLLASLKRALDTAMKYKVGQIDICSEGAAQLVKKIAAARIEFEQRQGERFERAKL